MNTYPRSYSYPHYEYDTSLLYAIGGMLLLLLLLVASSELTNHIAAFFSWLSNSFVVFSFLVLATGLASGVGLHVLVAS